MYAIRFGGCAIVVALALALPSWGGEPPAEPKAAEGRLDLHGDPLPEGALARLGSVRFRHAGAVHEVAFSPDGKILAASSDGYNMVVLWERATGRKLREIKLGTAAGQCPTRLRFSADGKRLHACSWYGREMHLYAWDVASGKIARDVPPFLGEARTLGYSPDGRELILLRRDEEIVCWDIDRGVRLGCYPRPGSRYLSIAARVGERVLVPYFDGEQVGMWDVAKQRQLWAAKTTRDKHYPGPPMTFSADGRVFAVEAPPGAISVFDSITGKALHRLEGGAGRIYFSLCISPDSRVVVGGNGDGTLHLWDLESGRLRLKVHTVRNCVPELFFSPDSRVFATGGGNNPHAVLLWETATGKPIDPYPGHTSPVSSVSFSPDGRTAATSSWLRGDPVVRLWDVQTGRLLRSFDPPDGGGATVVAFSPDGQSLATSYWTGAKKIRIWDVRTGRERHALTGHEHNCTCVAFSPDGKRLASGDNYYDRSGKYGGRLCVWDTEAGRQLREVRGTHGAIQQVLFTRDGRHILAAADGIHVYDAETGELVGEPFQAESRVWRLSLSADGRLLVAADGRGPVRLWELTTRREIPLAGPAGVGSGVALTPDGRTLAIGDPQRRVALLHWPSGETVGKLAGDAAIGRQVVFSPDGRRLATADNDESTALIWDVADLVNRPLPTVARPTEVELRRWWAELGEADPGKAYQAVWRFVAVPEQTQPFLTDNLRPVKAADAATVARWIDELDSDDFQVRERATRELTQLGDAVVDHLREARKGDVSLEKKRRIDQLLTEIAGPVLNAEELRATRAAAVLEQIGGPGARKVVVRLASGAAGARRTREAQAALERFKKAER